MSRAFAQPTRSSDMKRILAILFCLILSGPAFATPYGTCSITHVPFTRNVVYQCYQTIQAGDPQTVVEYFFSATRILLGAVPPPTLLAATTGSSVKLGPGQTTFPAGATVAITPPGLWLHCANLDSGSEARSPIVATTKNYCKWWG